MNDENTKAQQTYHVRVGHARVSVQCQSREQAIDLARRKLSSEMPRLYDLIHQMDVQRFQIEPAT
ncbi:MAG: hypothetical protein WDZ59_00370 [Pirellulales bacterium]